MVRGPYVKSLKDKETFTNGLFKWDTQAYVSDPTQTYNSIARDIAQTLPSPALAERVLYGDKKLLNTDFSAQDLKKIEAYMADVAKSSEKHATLRSIAHKVVDAYDGMAKSGRWIDGWIPSAQERPKAFHMY